MSAFGLSPADEKVLRRVLDSASGRGEPVKKIDVDRVVGDESRPVLDRLLQAGWIREMDGPRFVPTLQAMLVEEGAFQGRQLLDATVDHAAGLFLRGRDRFSVASLFEALQRRGAVFLEKDDIPGFNLQNALFGLEPFITVEDPSGQMPGTLRISPKIQTVKTLQDVLAYQQGKALAADESDAMRALYRRYLSVQTRRGAALGFNTDRQQRAFLRLLEAGKVERHGLGAFIFSEAGLDDARELFGADEEPATKPQTSAASERDQRIGLILADLEQVAAFDERLIEVLRRDVEVVEVCRNASGAEKAVLVFCGSILEGVLIAVLSKRMDLAEAAFKRPRGRQHKSFPDDASLEELLDLALDANLKVGAGPLLREPNEIIGELVTRHRNLVHPHAEARGEQLRVSGHSAEAVYSNLCVLLDEMLREIKAGWLARYLA